MKLSVSVLMSFRWLRDREDWETGAMSLEHKSGSNLRILRGHTAYPLGLFVFI